jgi:hypothetical protein
MARVSAGGRSSAGSTTLPIGSLYAPATRDLHLREIGVINTTAVAVALKLIRLTTAGTQGAGLTETSHDPTATPGGTAFNTHSIAPTLGGDLAYNIVLPGVVGAGVVWTFGGDQGLQIPGAVTNGVGIIVATGTGQICDFYFVWEE